MNLAAVLTSAGIRTPDAVAVRAGDEVRTTSALAVDAGLLAGGLEDAGIEPGDRVAIAMGNDLAFVIAYLGTLHAGAVAVPLNPTAPAAELQREIAGVGAKVVLASAQVAAAVAADGAPTGVRVVAVGSAEWDRLRAGTGRPIIDRADGDLAALIYTSGTSGPPKAAMLTHGNLRANIEQVQRHPGLHLDAGEVVLGALPLFHIYGLNVVLGVALAAGASVVLTDRFDAAGSAALVQQAGVTMLAGAPPMFAAWTDERLGLAPDTFSTVRLAVSGAAPLPPEIQRAFAERFGVAVHQGYGLTEASPIVTTSAVAQAVRVGSIGPPLPNVEVRLVDEDGDDVLAGDPGEIWVRGPNVFAGYWNDADTTARVLTADGWLRTGDVAVSEDGWLTIVDRAKDLILVSGFNVYPAEVEEVLASHPAVSEAAVVGVPDARSGESVHAFVVLRDGATIDDVELTAFAAQQLARYKCPTTITFVDELPHSEAGKVLRRKLRD